MTAFRMFSSWDPRSETAETLGARMLQHIDALSALAPSWRDWWFLDFDRPASEMNEENAHEFLFPLDEARPRMAKMVELGVRRGDDRRPEPTGGYAICAVNGEREHKASIHAHGGGGPSPRAGLRFVEFQTRPEPAPIAAATFKSALLALVAAWDVGYAQAWSDALCSLWPSPPPFYSLAWMTYLSSDRAAKIAPPDHAIVERTDDDGMLLLATGELFDAGNPQHLAAARAILAALAPLNAEEERIAERRFGPRGR